MIPLAPPLLIFGAGRLSNEGGTRIAPTATMNLVLLAITPFADVQQVGQEEIDRQLTLLSNVGIEISEQLIADSHRLQNGTVLSY